MSSAARAALIETFTLYALGTIIIGLRVFSRTKLVGLRGYRWDDYLVFVVWAAYTVMTVAAYVVGGVGDTSHLTMDERLAMTPRERQLRSLGSKWFMVGWYTYITLIWTLKFNMLCLYQRVVSGTWVEKFIKPAMGLVIASGLSIYLMFATGCRPFHKLWQVLPDPGPYCCPQSPVFLITVLALNLVTDLCIMVIPAPVIIPLKTSAGRKIGLLLLFSGGFFVMIAAILRVYYVLVQKQGQTAAIWSCREDVIAILVGQGTMIRSMFTKRFWGIKNDSTGASSSGGYSGKKGTGGSHDAGHEMSSRPSRLSFASKKPKDPYNVSVLETRNESEERIVQQDEHGAEQIIAHSPPVPTGFGYNSEVKSHGLREHPSYGSSRASVDAKANHTITVQKTVDIENLGDAEVGYSPEQKPTYGHNSRVHSKWHAF